MSGMKIQKKKEYKTSPFISKTNFKLLTRRKTWRLCRDKLHPIKFQRQKHLKNPTFVPWFVYIPLFNGFLFFCFCPKNSHEFSNQQNPNFCLLNIWVALSHQFVVFINDYILYWSFWSIYTDQWITMAFTFVNQLRIISIIETWLQKVCARIYITFILQQKFHKINLKIIIATALESSIREALMRLNECMQPCTSVYQQSQEYMNIWRPPVFTFYSRLRPLLMCNLD